jgi:TPR repeat protein
MSAALLHGTAAGQAPAASSTPAATHRFRQTLKDARAGQTEAQYQLGLMLANGAGTRKDVNEALSWIQRAAERGHAAAQAMLGTHYCPEPGTAPAEQAQAAKAFEWLFKAAAQGHPRAHWRLARLIRQSHQELAATHEHLAASLGLPEAQVAILKADGDPKAGNGSSLALRLQALRHAAEQGLLSAQTELGCLLLQSAARPGQQACDAEGLHWLQTAAAKRWPPAVLALVDNGAPVAALPRQLPDPVEADARHALGCLWERGLAGLPAHREEAIRWYALAAAQGHAPAQLALGRLAEPDRTEEAIAHFRQAAESGSAEASWRLAQLLQAPQRSPEDQLCAAYHRQRAVQAGHPEALLALSQCHDGRFGPLNAALRDHALARAAEAGLAAAQRLWAQRLHALAQQEQDSVGRQQRLEQAITWTQRASRQGDTAALTALGMAYRQGQGVPVNLSLGLQLLQEAAHQGEPSASWQLGLLKAAGASDVPRDLPAALAHCREAADTGFVPAQATLGVLCAASGQHAEAVNWWRLAAQDGDIEAQVNLAHALAQGQGTPKDEAAAFHWLLSAAESGLAVAQARLGLAYATGQGVAPDLLAAHQWFYIARHGGDSGAAENLQRSRGLLNEASQREAERRAQAWLKVRADVRADVL